MTIKARIAFAAAAVSLAIAGAAPALADSFSADQREESRAFPPRSEH